jgi:hypothetical protein
MLTIILLLLFSDSYGANMKTRPDFDTNSYFLSKPWSAFPEYAKLPDSLTLFTPVFTSSEQFDSLVNIPYVISRIDKKKLLDSLPIGTIYIADTVLELDTVHTTNIMRYCGGLRQIVKKLHGGYLGYLEEMLNVPFVLPPRHLSGFGHQTDHRIAVDCAEMAIYGKRRQGYDIPYCGPLRIGKYLDRTDSITAGTVIHFGFQVSVVYEDCGIPGKLDGEDLLIHAYKDKAEIIALNKTDLRKAKYISFTWKQHLPEFDKPADAGVR